MKARWVHRLGAALVATIGAGAMAFAAVIGLLAWKQEALLFQPQTLPAGFQFNFGRDVQESWV